MCAIVYYRQKKILGDELKKYIIKNDQLQINQLNVYLKQIVRTDLILFTETFDNLPDMQQKYIDTGVSGICENKLDFFIENTYQKYTHKIFLDSIIENL